MADEAAEFWSNFEKETGEKVEARSIGEFFRAAGNDIGVWGLLVLTDKSFRFKHMPGENWIMSLFKRMDRSSEKKEIIDIVIPRESIIAVNSPKGGFWARLLGPAFPRFSIASRAEGGEELHAFSVDPGTGLLAALIKAAPPSSRPE
jgi:hypothetical protein